MAERDDLHDKDRERGDYDTHGDWGRQGSWGNFANRPEHRPENEWREHPRPSGNPGCQITVGTISTS